jgi:2Fe-2S ferredoxin
MYDDVPPLPRVTFVDPQGDALAVPARVGDTVMQTARRLGVPGIRAECGGFMKCATCHVYVDSDCCEFLEHSEGEEEMLQNNIAAARKPTSRLACQMQIGPGSDVRVTIPEKQI